MMRAFPEAHDEFGKDGKGRPRRIELGSDCTTSQKFSFFNFLSSLMNHLGWLPSAFMIRLTDVRGQARVYKRI
jgi:hypothetical protein